MKTDGSTDRSNAARLALDRVTTVERMADGICEMILRGEVEPGTALRESQLQATIGVSRNTIREALRLLERDGLVTYNPFRGVTVTELDYGDVVDLFQARRTLELSAVESPIAVEQLDLMGVARSARENAVAEAEWHGAFQADIQFHAALVQSLASPTLDRFFVGLLHKIRLGFYLGGGLSTEGLERDTEQHSRIENTLRDGDRAGAWAAVLEHLEHAEGLLLDLLGAQDADKQTDDNQRRGNGSPRPRRPANDSLRG